VRFKNASVYYRPSNFEHLLKLSTRSLGNSDMEITSVGIGTAPIGSDRSWYIYWGETDEKTAIETIRTALDLGINWIDTAPFYGWGRGERIVGKALKGRREDAFIFTKCGTIRDQGGESHMDLRAETIRREVQESLARLQTDHIDLYQMHDVDPETHIEDSWREIYRLIDEGKVRYAGLSNHPIGLVERAMKIGPVTSLQEQYNPLHRETEGFFGFVSEHKVGLLGWGSLASGFLADGFDLEKLDPSDFRRTRSEFGKTDNYQKIKRIRQRLLAMSKSRHIKLASLVVAWELSHPELTGAIIGVKSPKEASDMVEAATTKLSRNDVDDFEAAISEWATRKGT
jgi:aryl-alcohol dehydrogenase-like predicted oxidoreductase